MEIDLTWWLALSWAPTERASRTMMKTATCSSVAVSRGSPGEKRITPSAARRAPSVIATPSTSRALARTEPTSAVCARGVSEATCDASVAVEHPIDQAVLDRLLGWEKAVALHVDAHLLGLALCVLGVDVIDAIAHAEDLARVDLDVGRLPFKAGRGLVDEDARVGQRGTLAFGPRGQQQRAHRHRHPDAHRLDVG